MPKFVSPSQNKVLSHDQCFLRNFTALMVFPCEKERLAFNQNLAATLTKSLRTMLTQASSEQGRAAVPPITNADVSPFPMKIVVSIDGNDVG